MKRVEFTILGQHGESLHAPGVVEHCADLPAAIMQAVADYLEAQEGHFDLPITIHVQPSAPAASS